MPKWLSDENTSNEKTPHRFKLSFLKRINHSLKTSDIQKTVKAFKDFKEYYSGFYVIIEELGISDQTTEYYATWFKKTTTLQIKSISNKFKTYLHLLCYIKHQYYIRQDFLVDIFLKSVRVNINSVNKKIQIKEKENRAGRNKAIQ